jgi:hypothetical protein
VKPSRFSRCEFFVWYFHAIHARINPPRSAISSPSVSLLLIFISSTTTYCAYWSTTHCARASKFRYNLQTVRAYLLKEDFQHFWEYTSPTWAGMFLDFWCYETMRSRIEPMKKIARTLRAHRTLLLNYFKARKQFSSGVIEGLNNKAKVTMRRSYGFRTFRILELALYHSLGKLPQPELTHEFF